MMIAVAGLLMITAALVGLLDALGLLHNACTTREETADQTGRRLIADQARDERETAR
ncbi:hypothetical protein [Microbacterium sp. IO18]|uniref:hypothetical protein n=1 Tax=Microbacterium sp. IO18 TaxID=3390997 RepID=UPI003B9F70FC